MTSNNNNNNNNSILKVENKYDGGKVKQALDDAICEHLMKIGFVEDNHWTDFRIFFSLIAVSVAVLAHFAPIPFPEIKPLLVICVLVYACASLILEVINRVFVRDDIFVSKNGVEISKKQPIAVSTELEARSANYTIRVRPMKGMFKWKRGTQQGMVKKTEKFSIWICENGVIRKDLINKYIDSLIASLATTKND